MPITNFLLINSCRFNHIDVVNYLGGDSESHSLKSEIQSKCIGIVNHLKANNKYNHLDFVKYIAELPETNLKECGLQALRYAVMNNYIEIVKYLSDKVDIKEDDDFTIKYAIENNLVEIIEIISQK